MSYPARFPRRIPAYLAKIVNPSRRQVSDPGAYVTQPLRIRCWNRHLIV